MILEELEEEGKYIFPSVGNTARRGEELRGRYRANQRGFGFVVVEDDPDDTFIAEENAGGALDGDVVEFTIIRSPQGEVRKARSQKFWSMSLRPS